MAWDVLEEEEKTAILALFPDDQHVLAKGTMDARPDFISLKNDDSFRYDCANYTENIKQGRHDPEWLASAWSAHERRKMGDFDDFLEKKFNDQWEVEIPEAMMKRRHKKRLLDKDEEDVEMKEAQVEVKKDATMVETDELQGGGGDEMNEAKRLAVRASRLDIDGSKSEDELA